MQARFRGLGRRRENTEDANDLRGLRKSTLAKAGNLLFKVSERTIVIIKDLPVLQCENCANYLLEDGA